MQLELLYYFSEGHKSWEELEVNISQREGKRGDGERISMVIMENWSRTKEGQ